MGKDVHGGDCHNKSGEEEENSDLHCRFIITKVRYPQRKQQFIHQWQIMQLIAVYNSEFTVQSRMEQAPSNIQHRQQSLQKLLQEKQSIINRFVDRCNRQQQQLAQLLTEQDHIAKLIPYKLYSPFLIPSHATPQQFYLVLKVNGSTISNKQAIWASTNLQIVNGQQAVQTPIKGTVKYFVSHTPQKEQINRSNKQLINQNNIKSKNIPNSKNTLSNQLGTKQQEEYCANLSRYAQQLKNNLSTCQQFLQDLKQLKQMDLLERQQDQNNHPPTKDSGEQMAALKKQNLQLEQQLSRLTAVNDQLKKQIQELKGKNKNIFSSFRQDKQSKSEDKKIATDTRKQGMLNEKQIKKQGYVKVQRKEDNDRSHVSGSPWTIKTDDQFRRVKKPKITRFGYE